MPETEQALCPDPDPDPRYAAFCRKGPHLPIAHHERHRYDCDCPCHIGNEASPWWTQAKAKQS